MAVAAAGKDFALGNRAAGYGAVAGKYKGGLGSVSPSPMTASRWRAVAVNAVGSPLIAGTDVFWAFPFEQNGGVRRTAARREVVLDLDLPDDMKGARPQENTTIAIVATDAALTRPELARIAVMAADGFARALRPCIRRSTATSSSP